MRTAPKEDRAILQLAQTKEFGLEIYVLTKLSESPQ